MTLSRRHIDGTAARSLLGRAKNKPLTYDAVGMSLGHVPAPKGFREYHESKVVGTGDEAFRNIGWALMHWNVHRGAGIFVQPEFNVVRTGDAVAVAVPSAPFVSTAGACRVTEVVALGTSIGFACGTLPGHPAIGEESFVLTHRDDDQVELTVRSFSRPAIWYVRVAGPVGRSIQHRVNRRLFTSASQLASVSPVNEAEKLA